MNRILLLLVLTVVATASTAETLSGKRFKVTVTKTPEGRVVEGEVWDVTKVKPAPVVQKAVPVPVQPQAK